MISTAPAKSTYPSSRATVLRLAAMLTLAGFLVGFSSLAMPNSASALSGSERNVSKIAGSVIALANSSARGTALHKKFERLLSTRASMNSVALFSLGRYRKDLPAKMKSRYLKLVKAYIAGLFVYYAEDFKGRTVEIRGSRKSGRSVIVDSRLKFGGNSRTVLWRVFTRGNSHKVTDVNIRGVWLRIQMRQKFTQLLKRKKGDFGALLVFLGEYKNWMPKS